MKKAAIAVSIATILLLGCSTGKNSFKSDCSELVFDLTKGTLNKVPATVLQADVKNKFNCFTGATEDGADYNCGGGVFFLNHDFYFYTGNDYIETRKKFKGIYQPDISSITKETIEKTLGTAVSRPDANTYLFKKTYGTLRIEFKNNQLDKVSVHYKTPEEVKLCR